MDKDLKEIWKLENPQSVLKNEDVDHIIKQKSTNTIDQIKNSLKHEFKIVCILYPLVIIAFSYFGIYTASILFFIVFVAWIFYYFKLSSKLNLNAISLTSYEYLKISYERLKQYMTYFKTIALFFMVTSFFLGLEFSGVFDNFPTKFVKIAPSKLILLVGLLLIVLFIFFFGYLKYLNYKHSKRLKNLKKLLKDFESERE